MNQTLIEIRDLRVGFSGREVVHGVNLDIRRGECLAIRDSSARLLQQFVVLGQQGIALGAEQVAQVAGHRAQTALVDSETIFKFGTGR